MTRDLPLRVLRGSDGAIYICGGRLGLTLLTAAILEVETPREWSLADGSCSGSTREDLEPVTSLRIQDGDTQVISSTEGDELVVTGPLMLRRLLAAAVLGLSLDVYRGEELHTHLDVEGYAGHYFLPEDHGYVLIELGSDDFS